MFSLQKCYQSNPSFTVCAWFPLSPGTFSQRFTTKFVNHFPVVFVMLTTVSLSYSISRSLTIKISFLINAWPGSSRPQSSVMWTALHMLVWFGFLVPTILWGKFILRSHLSQDKTSTADLNPIYNLMLNPTESSWNQLHCSWPADLWVRKTDVYCYKWFGFGGLFVMQEYHGDS